MELLVADASRQPIQDPCLFKLLDSQSNRTVKTWTLTGAKRAMTIDNSRVYLLQVFPLRHRPVQQFAFNGPHVVELYTALDPERVTKAEFPGWGVLPHDCQMVLVNSEIEGFPGLAGATLYQSFTDLQRAGLLNLYAKLTHERLTESAPIWSYVQKLYRVRQDRIFADVDPGLRDLVKGHARFREVSGSLHSPPPGYRHVGSFKTSDPYGNLQLTFFGNDQAQFKVDADIDDASGIGHVFQVLNHALTNGTTHPYDIHQILTFRQDIPLLYSLE